VSLLPRLMDNGVTGGASPLAALPGSRELFGISALFMSLLTVHRSDALEHRDIDAVPASTTDRSRVAPDTPIMSFY
jgi:hypothetical protein